MKRLALAASCVLGALALLAFLAGPHLDSLPPFCAFRALTGRPCIFCGMSHAVAFAVRGDLTGASASHPTWFLVLPLFAAFVGSLVTKQKRLSWAIVLVLILGTFVRAVQ